MGRGPLITAVALLAFGLLVAAWLFIPAATTPVWLPFNEETATPTPTETPHPEWTPGPGAQKLGSEFIRTTNGLKYAYRNKLNDVVYFVRVDTFADGTAKAELEIAPLKQVK